MKTCRRIVLWGIWVALSVSEPVSAQVRINELLAANAGTNLDRDGDASDWVEIRNGGAEPVDLEGYGLSDQPEEPFLWRFPAVTIAAGDYLLVWCSGKDRSRPELHASFRLDAEGDTVLLTTPDRQVLDVTSYPEQVPDQSYGRSPDGTGEFAYHLEPTPAAANSGPTGDEPLLVETVELSHTRGFYDAPFSLTLSTSTQGAEIRYTRDGTRPTAEHGEVYTTPVPVNTTTILRARALREGRVPSPVETHTYIFIDAGDGSGVLHQPELPPGLPERWGVGMTDYGMDARVTLQEESPFYNPSVGEALLALPTLSLVLPSEDLFGTARGIYANPLASGPTWERATSVELIHPDGAPGFQLDAGLRIHGGISRETSFLKHNLRLLFKRIYGQGKLRYPLFSDSPVAEFDTIVLRGANGDAWFHPNVETRERALYLRDEWHRDAQLAMEGSGARQAHLHVYLNGLYWGVYHALERPSAPFLAAHFGGEREDWDASILDEPVDGDLDAWNTMVAMAESGLETQAAYEAIQEYLAVPNLIDYLLANFYSGNEDWDNNNWYAGRRREAGAGYRFFVWDSESSFRNINTNRTVLNFPNRPTGIHGQLRENLEYVTRFGDHAQRHLTAKGTLSPAGSAAIFERQAERLRLPLVAESARWGDTKTPRRPHTIEDWEEKLRQLLEEYVPARSAVLRRQLQVGGLFPVVEAPVFRPLGGFVAPGTSIFADAPIGTLYYTLDGSDPRLPGGSISPTARSIPAPAEEVLVGLDAPLRYLVPDEDVLGDSWNLPDFDDSSWLEGSAGIGFSQRGDYGRWIRTDVKDLMLEKRASVFVRIPFQGEAASDARELLLRVRYDDGFAAYLNGVRIAERNVREELKWNSSAPSGRATVLAEEWETIRVPEARDLIQAGENVLAFQVLNWRSRDTDLLLLAQLSLVEERARITDGLDTTTHVRARTFDADRWSALSEATFRVEEVPLRITEIHYNPWSVGGAEVDEQDFEFLEIENAGPAPVELAGLRIDGAIEFVFPADAGTLPPGGLAVLGGNLDALTQEYDLPEDVWHGQYAGRLSNEGEQLTLRAPGGEPILEIGYENDWYPATDGFGYSLVLASLTLPPDAMGNRGAWRVSDQRGGSPGRNGVARADEPPGGSQRRGDATQDGRVNIADGIALLEILFTTSETPLPCAGDPASAGNRTVLDANDDGQFDVSDPLALLGYLFQGADVPSLAAGCQTVAGCATVCVEP